MRSDKSKLKIGIWFPLHPFGALAGEGIFRLLCQIIKAASAQENTSTRIATTIWTREPLEDQLHDNAVSLDKVEIFTTRRRNPLAVRLLEWLTMTRPPKRPKPPFLRLLLRKAAEWRPLQRMSFWMLMTENYLAAIIASVVFGLVLLILLPLCLLLWVVGRALGKLGVVISPSSLRRKLLDRALDAHRQARWRRIYEILISGEVERLAEMASRDDDVNVWFVPHPWALEATKLGKPLVVAIPDAVYADFPTLFHRPEWAIRDGQMREVLARASKAITYSEYVRTHQVRRYLGGEDEKITVIRHAPMDISHHLQDMTDRHAGDTRQAALALIRKHIATAYRPPAWAENLPADYLEGFPFDEVRFLFASSQIRMHKNFLNFFKAFEILLRRRYVNLKLFITGRLETREGIEPHATLRDFLKERRLELDVISVPDLPSDVHAAFYHLATLTVVPSLFEGGFPFPFTESLSVGTPAVMSSIPVNLEVLPEKLQEITLFDPYSIDDMCDKIEWGVTHRDELLEKQMPFYRELQSRTWDDVAAEYMKVFKAAANAG